MEFIMVYHFSSTTSAAFPHSVTKASDMIAAICNRNDTPRVIGPRVYGPYAKGHVIPLSHSAMARILGADLGHKFMTVRNEAVMGYFMKIVERLQSVGIHIAYSPSCWFIAKLPKSENETVASASLYTTRELMEQRPAGLPVDEPPVQTDDSLDENVA